MEALYQERILDHYRRPHNKSLLPSADRQATVRNPLCGEEITVTLALDAGVGDAEPRIRQVRFQGQGCSISQASASMMTDLVPGKTAAEIAALESRFAALLRGDRSAAEDESLGPLRAFVGVARVPVRIPCALLAWAALARAMGRAPSFELRESS